MAVLSILLSVMAMLSQSAETVVLGQNSYAPEEGSVTEASASELNAQLNVANRLAAEAAVLQIGPMLNAAYQPVYEAIPTYADYHYSVWGEYAELGTAVIGDVGAKLDEMLFGTLEKRLANIGVELDSIFSLQFQTELKNEGSSMEVAGSGLGPLTENAIADAQRRMLITVPIGTAAIASTKAIAAIIAKKIAAKLAAKAALKASGKWAAIGTGAGGGAALCSWSGPGAGLCAAAGGVGAWLIADYGIVKLDEYWNREDFENELREMIDEQKLAHQVALENAIMARAFAVQEMSGDVVEQHDFTLREFSGVGNAEICRIAEGLVERYDLFRDSLGERNPAALRELRAAATEQSGNLSIGRLAQEMTENLSEAEQVTVTSVQIEGNLPIEQRADRDVSGRLLLNGTTTEIPQTHATEDDGFLIEFVPEAILTVGQPLNYAIALEQHLRIWGHPYFGGQGEKEILASIGAAGGLEHRINIALQISYDGNAASIQEVSTTSITGEPLSLILELRAKSLPALQKSPNCD